MSAWAAEHRDDVEGRAAMVGIDVDSITAASLYPILYSMIVDESFAPAAGETRAVGRERVDEWLDEVHAAYADTTTHAEETWGLLPEHQSGIDAALAMAGVVHGADTGAGIGVGQEQL